MLFGTTTMTFFSRPILEALDAITRCGFDCAEIWVDHATDKLRGASTEAIRDSLKKNNLQSTVHCPIMNINITSPNEGIREESIRQILQTIDFAKELDARLVVIHPGVKYSDRESSAVHWDLQVDSIKRIVQYAKEKDVITTIENLDSDKAVVSVKDWPDLVALFQDCEISDGLITLDVTHLQDTERILNFIENVGDQIAHLHLSDGTPEKMHLRIGDGNMDLETIAGALIKSEFEGVCSLECFIPNDESMLKAELEKARKLFKVTN